MKNNLLKFYIFVIYLCTTLVLSAQTPGSNDDTSTLESNDAVATPIDTGVWILFIMGLLFAFTKYKNYSLERKSINLALQLANNGEISKKLSIK